MLDTSIQVKTEHFDGPLALLLFLIKKEELSIENLDLTRVTEQYLDYLSGMDELDFDVAGNYLYLATTLLFIKSKMAVSPTDPLREEDELDGDDSSVTQDHAELIHRLMTLAHFQKMGQALGSLPLLNRDVFVKPAVDKKHMIQSLLVPMDLESILVSIMNVLERERKTSVIVNKEGISIEEKFMFLKETLNEGDVKNFEELLGVAHERRSADDMVITFISLLELARTGTIRFVQENHQTPLHIQVVAPVPSVTSIFKQLENQKV